MGVYINGIGAISEAACIAEEFSALAEGRNHLAKGQMTEFASAVPASKLRRASRYSKLTVSAAAFALKDSETEFTDPYRTGAVIASGYGAAEYNIQFSDQVQGGEPQLCSPSVFSQSVANSCLGQLCMIEGIKGESTMLRGGDPLEYASLLLETDRADIMLCGETEEWSEELIASFNSKEASSGAVISEGSAFAVLGTEKNGCTYCKVSDHSSAALGACPLLDEREDIASVIKEVLSDMPRNADVIFTAANGTWFDAVEAGCINEVFADIPSFVPKAVFGETLGSSYMLSVCLAAAALKNGSFRGRACVSVIVTGFDMTGNYMAVRLTGVGV